MPTNKKRSLQLALTFLLLLLPWYTYAIGRTDHESAAYKQEGIEKTLLFDRYWSPYAAASLIMSGRALFNKAEDHLITPKSPAYFLTRWGAAIAHNFINDMLISHEVNGHGFRARSFGDPGISYDFNLKFVGVTPFLRQ